MDNSDDLAPLRAEFDIPEGIIYLDGNSLGALAHRTRERIREVGEREWGRGLIASWTGEANWMALPTRTGDKVARLIGARAGEVVVGDSTTVNLYKALALAIQLQPGRRVLLTDRGNFPTDHYVAQGLAAERGLEVLRVEGDEASVEAMLDARGAEIAAVFLTHTHYTSSRVYDMRRVTAAAHRAGAAVVWDLSHSAGVMALDVDGCGVDFAVGCGYKYLNGGPGAPGYLYVPRRHQHLAPPISGWMGDARPFDFRADYIPAEGISRFLSGTPSVMATAALEASLDVMLQASPAALRAKSMRLTALFIGEVERECPGSGLVLASPTEASLRGGHVSYRHPRSVQVLERLRERGVFGDCRPPDLLRFGFAPLYVGEADVRRAVALLRECLS